MSSPIACFTILSRAFFLGWPQQRCQVILSVGLFFNGFFEETGTAAYDAVTDITAVKGTVVAAVTAVAVVAVVAVNAAKTTAL